MHKNIYLTGLLNNIIKFKNKFKNSKNMKKILVGCPTSDSHEYCLNEYVDMIKNLTYKNYSILLVDNSKEKDYFQKIKDLGIPVIKGPYYEGALKRVVTSRNIIRQHVLDEGYDYFLSLEQDVIPPKDIIEKLLAGRKSIVTGVYFKPCQKEQEYSPMLWGNYNKGNENVQYFSTNFILSHKGLLKVDACGLGCILIHRSVLKKIRFRYEEDLRVFDDMHFSIDVKKNDFQIFANTEAVCKHLLEKKKWSWDSLKW